MSLGRLLGHLGCFLGGLKSEKMPTVSRENHFFTHIGCWFYEDHNGTLGLILVSVGQIWFQNGYQYGSKSAPNYCQKISKKS